MGKERGKGKEGALFLTKRAKRTLKARSYHVHFSAYMDSLNENKANKDG